MTRDRYEKLSFHRNAEASSLGGAENIFPAIGKVPICEFPIKLFATVPLCHGYTHKCIPAVNSSSRWRWKRKKKKKKKEKKKKKADTSKDGSFP